MKARALVNAAGPGRAVSRRACACAAAEIAAWLVKGSHIVVPKMFEHEHAYIFQNPDKRIIFAIPYEGEFTLIGTTDVGAPRAIGEGEDRRRARSITCASRRAVFAAKAGRPADVVWSYSGVRPLLDDDRATPRP